LWDRRGGETVVSVGEVEAVVEVEVEVEAEAEGIEAVEAVEADDISTSQGKEAAREMR